MLRVANRSSQRGDFLKSARIADSLYRSFFVARRYQLWKLRDFRHRRGKSAGISEMP